MPIANLYDGLGQSLGQWDFSAIPSLGEIVVVRDDDFQPYKVDRIEHFPIAAKPADGLPLEARIEIYLSAYGLPR